jgi:hypothetical protein
MSNKAKVAALITSMTYQELTDLAQDFVAMQRGAKESGWEWIPDEVYGEFGLANMLASWAESQGED